MMCSYYIPMMCTYIYIYIYVYTYVYIYIYTSIRYTHITSLESIETHWTPLYRPHVWSQKFRPSNLERNMLSLHCWLQQGQQIFQSSSLVAEAAKGARHLWGVAPRNLLETWTLGISTHIFGVLQKNGGTPKSSIPKSSISNGGIVHKPSSELGGPPWLWKPEILVVFGGSMFHHGLSKTYINLHQPISTSNCKSHQACCHSSTGASAIDNIPSDGKEFQFLGHCYESPCTVGSTHRNMKRKQII